MEQTIKDRGYHLSVAGKGFTLPMAFYSKKVKSFAEAPKGATVGIPNDPAMGGRALFLLEKGGVIKLRKGVGYTPSVLDIVENPKDLKFVELEAAQLPHSLNDLTISAVNGNYAYVANLNPTRDGILVEDADGPYVCNIVVNTKDLGKPWVKQLVEAYQQPQIAAWIKEKYKGIVIPGF
ncbi:MetQ/NlpA family ABC transporter substrate-binding protein [Sutterella wadsworthensis]|jgi:lipoprotein, yaeC family